MGGLVGVWMGGCLGVWVSVWVGVWVAGWISLLKDQLSPPEFWLELVMILATLEDPLYVCCGHLFEKVFAHSRYLPLF